MGEFIYLCGEFITGANMAIIFRLSTKSRKKDGFEFFEVMARFHSGKIDQYAKTSVFVTSSFTDRNGNKKETWKDGGIVIPRISYADEKSVEIKKLLGEAKEKLFAIENYVEESYSDMVMRAEKPKKGWLQSVINKVMCRNCGGSSGSDNSQNGILVSYALEMFIGSDRQTLSQGSLKQFKLLLKYIKEYEKKNGTTLMLDETTPDMLHDFRKSFTANGKSENYATSILRMMRTFYRWANGLSRSFPIEPMTSNNPFERYSVGSEQYGTPFYLTIDERNALQDADMGSERLERQRDIFVFQCLIGCRISDLYALTKESVIRDAIEYIPRKTKEGRPITVRVPLNDRAKAIIAKYADCDGEGLLPLVNMQQYNEDIKEMLRIAGITRSVTILDPVTREEVKRPICEVASSHMARRTFVGNLYKQVKDPNLIGKLSGHVEGSKAFARYRDIDEDIAKELVSMLG